MARKTDAPRVQTNAATLSLPQVTVAPSSQITVALNLALAQGSVYSADIVLTYDPEVVVAIAVYKGALVADWSLAANLNTAGVARLALAGAQPVSGSGQLAVIGFLAVGGEGTATDVVFNRAELNEGAMGVTWQNGRITVTTVPCHDFDGSGAVDAGDLQLITGHWRQRAGNPGWDPRFDLDGDGDVDVADIMRVARMLGSRCGQ